jgi:hypothetical protein
MPFPLDPKKTFADIAKKNQRGIAKAERGLKHNPTDFITKAALKANQSVLDINAARQEQLREIKNTIEGVSEPIGRYLGGAIKGLATGGPTNVKDLIALLDESKLLGTPSVKEQVGMVAQTLGVPSMRAKKASDNVA